MPINNPLSVYDLSFQEFLTLFNEWGEPKYRANQIWQGLYKHYWQSTGDFSSFSTRLRERLRREFIFNPLTVRKSIVSPDKRTIKTLFQLQDGKTIETVLMKYRQRQTLCISSQVGCAMGCVFCATGQMGFIRHLTASEMVAQVLYFANLLSNEGKVITNIVLMGMGEPFHNYENTLTALNRLNETGGFNFGARRITISTVGLIPEIGRFTKENRQINLAVSLHSADDKIRASIIPVSRVFPVDELFAVCREYSDITHRRITFEWALIQNVNDTPDQIQHFIDKARGLRCHVNAIPLNSTSGYFGKPSTPENAIRFQQTLQANNIPCTLRLSRGEEIKAGCGQLASRMGNENSGV
jgi:23S rRNA (adenine2503-C2)-methyltransferase